MFKLDSQRTKRCISWLTATLTAGVWATVVMIVAGGPLAVDVWAQLPRTRLDSVFPPGGKAGSSFTVTITGELSEAATHLVFSHDGIEATQRFDPPGEFTVAHRRVREFDVNIGGQVPDGLYEVRAVGPAGLSGPRTFAVRQIDRTHVHSRWQLARSTDDDFGRRDRERKGTQRSAGLVSVSHVRW